jgi:phenylacetate-CoA ligase
MLIQIYNMKQKKSIVESISNYMHFKASGGTSVTSEAVMMILNYPIFKKTYNFLKESQNWSREKLEKHQIEQLKKLINHSYENVPYYHKVFKNQGLKPEDIKNLSDLQKIPFLTKEIIKEHIDDLKAKNYPEYKFRYMTTGGSTGNTIGIYEEDSVSYIKDLAYYKIVIEQLDCKLSDKSVIIKEGIISDKDEDKFWKYSLFGRCLILSSFHLNQKNLPVYINKIRKLKPKFIMTYPSAITIIANYMKDNNIPSFKTLKIITCLGENLYDGQRKVLEEFFGCKVIGIYEHTEQSVYGFTCKYKNYYHFFPQYGITELVDKDGKIITKDGAIGEIVATGFKNFLFPIIRYKTGDLGIYTSEKCLCGRNFFLLKKIEGRNQDFIVTKNSSLISLAAVNIHSKVLKNIKQLQFYQETPGILIIKIIKKDAYTEKDSEEIKQHLHKKLGKDAELIIKFVDQIPVTMRGKYRYLVQKIQINEIISER